MRLVEQTTASWEFWFGLLERFVEHHGHARVNRWFSTVDGYDLGGWVKTQRSDDARGTLNADRRRRLEELAGWTWDPHADRWEEGFRRLSNYMERHGDARVPNRYTVDGYPLGVWVAEQRARYAEGILAADRRGQLRELPGWTWDPHADRWEEGFRQLLRYVECHGDARVPKTDKYDGYALGQWVNMQRSKHAKGILDATREQRLEDLAGWMWNTVTDRWEEGFRQLLHYIECHGDALVPNRCSMDGYPLGNWVANQRSFHSRGELDTGREHRLESVPGWTWTPKADQWEEGFRRLLDYVERQGDTQVPHSYTVDGYQLGRWVIVQRRDRVKGILDADRQRRLEDLRGWSWDPRSDLWEEGFCRLLEYVKRHGDARVPSAYTSYDGHRLGGWVSTQRSFHGRGILDVERARRLDELPGWTWNARP